MNPTEIRDYVDRDWQLLRELKDRYWAERKREMSPDEALRLGDRLRELGKRLRPDWPSAADREADLQVHVRVSESLRRVVTDRL